MSWSLSRSGFRHTPLRRFTSHDKVQHVGSVCLSYRQDQEILIKPIWAAERGLLLAELLWSGALSDGYEQLVSEFHSSVETPPLNSHSLVTVQHTALLLSSGIFVFFCPLTSPAVFRILTPYSSWADRQFVIHHLRVHLPNRNSVLDSTPTHLFLSGYHSNHLTID